MLRLRRMPLAQLRLRALLKPSQSKPYGFASSPKGRGLGKEMKLAWTAKGSHFEERLPPRRGKMSRSDKRGNLANEMSLRGRGRLKI